MIYYLRGIENMCYGTFLPYSPNHTLAVEHIQDSEFKWQIKGIIKRKSFFK